MVADYGPTDELFAAVTRYLSLAAPEARILLTQVAPHDTLAAGFRVACLALGGGPPRRVVVHDVDAPLAAEAGPRECAGWAPEDVAIVGRDTGWCWSFVAPEIRGPCYLELPARGPRSRSPLLLVEAIVRSVSRHPHAVCGLVAPNAVPPIPPPAVAYVDAGGNLATTITRPPAQAGRPVRVRIGDTTATAVVSDGSVAVDRGALMLGPTRSGWQRRDGGPCGFLELSMPDGSAAECFHRPSTGTEIVVEPD
jgi:hypothetical protein